MSAAPLLALKVDVDTLRGTQLGVPSLVRMFERRGANATFLFSLGPDHTGRALRRVFRRGFVGKVARTSVLSHYGLRTLLRGTLLPGVHIGRRCRDELRAVRAAGFEVGLHAYDHVKWQDFVADRGTQWTQREMQLGLDAFAEVFGAWPAVHGAAGWQMNACAFRAEAGAGMRYASDTRGTHPFLPMVEGEVLGCAQLPTTLPTLDELIGLDGCTPAAAVARLLEQTRSPPRSGHVYTLHAELEGMRLQPLLESLLEGWHRQGYVLASLGQMYEQLEVGALPVHRIGFGAIPGRSGKVMVQQSELARGADASEPDARFSARVQPSATRAPAAPPERRERIGS